jgi:small multidrug resistance pump
MDSSSKGESASIDARQRKMMAYVYLTVAIAAEVIGTTALKASEGFTRLGPSLIVVLGYAVSFYGLSIVLKILPVGITYAVWSGLGIVLVTITGAIVFRQIPDAAAMLGMGLIIAGVLIANVFSATVPH